MTRRSPATILAAAAADLDPALHGIAPPLWTSDAYRWADSDTKPDYDYARTVSPNRDMLADVLAELEGAAGGVVTGSGQSAALLTLLLLPAEAKVVAPHDCYGGTYRLIRGLEEQRRLRAEFVDMSDPDGFALDDAAMVWIESPSNPLLRLTDIARVAERARAAGAVSVADNTLPTPLRQRPIALGCDLVIHSTTKAINGHGDWFGGAVLARDDALVERLHWWSNAAGLNATPHGAWHTLRGMRTLSVRLDRQEATAGRIAVWLAGHDRIAAVHYPGLAGHPDAELARRQQDGPGFMISFELKGGETATADFLGNLGLITLASSLGAHSTLICKPATMTHRGMPPEAQAAAGLGPNLLRLSVGLEEAGDLIADLERGFAGIG
ncbi:MAG TPA: PLP-dependent transferase [Allosphingosinicella sp.]|nr:PLP-dependent transferase [Allosphingosinicella sp.]